MREPVILSIIGKSDSGKTTLILKLLRELRKRKYRVAVAKHCPHGFNLDVSCVIASVESLDVKTRDKVSPSYQAIAATA